MTKKRYILTILFTLTALTVFTAAIGSKEQLNIQSLESYITSLWQTSGHADSSSEAFRHWDEEGEIPADCAKCHSTPGAVSFLISGSTDAVSPGTTVECSVCHTNPAAGNLHDHSTVSFPSGAIIENLGPEAICMECHQGRASKINVDAAIAGAGIEDDDTISPSITFINIHYYAAAATQFGTVVKGGYEYEGKSYDARFSHITGYNACNTCHDPHTLHIKEELCATCHTFTDPKDIRFYGSYRDYDGDGNMTEGMYYEVEGLKDILYQTIQEYGCDITGYPIVYDSHSYPYFFNDTNNNGEADDNEVNYGNRYTSFTARLLRAAYNYQVAQKDPAGYAHGGKYLIELMYDSIEDLNSVLYTTSYMTGLHRGDEGHFDGSSEAWRHWDTEGEVSSSCAKCHSATGLQDFIQNGEITETHHPANGMLCTTCHFSGPPRVSQIIHIKFPSNAFASMHDASNLCLSCHQGRASKYDVRRAVSNSAGPYGFINIHYFPAAAVLFGSEVSGGFEYAGKYYQGQNNFLNHNGRFDTCIECHMGSKSKGQIDTPRTDWHHNVAWVDPANCVYCHGQDVSQPYPGAYPSLFTFSGIRPASIPDYDGDRNKTESLKNEIKGLEQALYLQMQDYGFKIEAPIVYDSHTYPYFFNDLNGNGKVDPGENIFPNGYQFNARMLKAAYNFHLSKKEPNGYIHNSRYIAELLVDSIIDLGGNEALYTWR
jgi:hypothetical protein